MLHRLDVGPGDDPRRLGRRGDDDVLEGDPEAVAGRLGYGLLARPGDQEVVVALRRRLGQGILLAVGQHVADQGIGVVAAGMPGAADELLDIHTDRSDRCGSDRYAVTGVADGQLKIGAGDAWLAVRLAALGAGTVKADVRRGAAEPGRDGGLGQGTADQEALPVLLAAVTLVPATLGVVEQRLEMRGSVLTASPPYVGRCRGLRHSPSLVAGCLAATTL
jgi:hypothetical protein